MLNRRAAIICACFIVPAAGLPDDLIPTDRDPVLYPTYRAVIVKKLSDYIEFWYVKGGRIAYSVVDASHYRAVRTPEKMESIEDQWHSRRRREASQRPPGASSGRVVVPADGPPGDVLVRLVQGSASDEAPGRWSARSHSQVA